MPRVRRRSRPCLSGLLLNVALYALLRFKMLLAANPHAIAPGPLMIGMGLLSLIFAAFMLYRRRDIKRLFAYSLDRAHGHHRVRVRHGRAAGQLCRPVADDDAQPDQVGDLLFGRAHAQVKGSQRIADIGGLTESHPRAWVGAGRRCRGDRRVAAVRHFHQ